METTDINLCETERFNCPICGEIILKTNSDGFIFNNLGKLYGAKICPHLAYISSWGWDDYDSHFILVGQDYAKRLVDKINNNDLMFRNEMQEAEISITDEDISRFLKGDLQPEDELSGVFTSLPFDHNTLLHSDAIQYVDSYGFGNSGVIIVIEP